MACETNLHPEGELERDGVGGNSVPQEKVSGGT